MNKTVHQLKMHIIKVQFDLIQSLWRFIKVYFFEVELFLVIAGALSLYKRIPYINLVISPVIYYVLLAFIAIRLFSFTVKQIIYMVMVAFIAMIFFAVNHQSAMTDMLADVVYFILCYLCLRMIIDMRKQL